MAKTDFSFEKTEESYDLIITKFYGKTFYPILFFLLFNSIIIGQTKKDTIYLYYNHKKDMSIKVTAYKNKEPFSYLYTYYFNDLQFIYIFIYKRKSL